MGRVGPRRLCIVALYVVGFQAITPDSDNLASSMAFRLMGMRPADWGGPSNDGDSPDGTAALAGPEITSRPCELARAPRLATGRCVGSALATGFHVGALMSPVVGFPRVVNQLHSLCRLNC